MSRLIISQHQFSSSTWSPVFQIHSIDHDPAYNRLPTSVLSPYLGLLYSWSCKSLQCVLYCPSSRCYFFPPKSVCLFLKYKVLHSLSVFMQPLITVVLSRILNILLRNRNCSPCVSSFTLSHCKIHCRTLRLITEKKNLM